MTEITRYYFDVPESNPNFKVNITPISNEGEFTLEVKFCDIKSMWLYKITYTNSYTISTGWRLLCATKSLNFEYQKVMPCSIGLESTTELSPNDLEDLNNDDFKFYMVNWNEL